jgi:hypothetical protein
MSYIATLAGGSRPFVNPVFAQLKTVLLCRFLAVKDRAVDPMAAVLS